LGCTSTASVTITVLPIPALTPVGATVCSGDQANISVTVNPSSGTYNYQWSTGATTPNITVTPPLNTSTVSSTTNYTVTVSIPSTGCANTIVVPVVVNPLPAVAGPFSQTICSGNVFSTVNFNSTLNTSTTYQWTLSSASSYLSGYPTGPGAGSIIGTQVNITSGTVAGTVVYSVTPSSLGCDGPSSNFTLNVNPLPVVNPLTPQTICNNSNLLLLLREQLIIGPLLPQRPVLLDTALVPRITLLVFFLTQTFLTALHFLKRLPIIFHLH
jgi:hypothetical protein